MPKINTTKGGGVIRWDGNDWMKGLSPMYIRTTAQNFLGGDGLLYADGINPFNKPGYLWPGLAATDVTNVSVVAGVIRNGASDPTAGVYAYLIEAATKLHRLDLTTYSLTNAGAWPNVINLGATVTHAAHTTPVGSDVIAYSHNIGGTLTKSIFYSFTDNTDWDVARFDLTATFDEDFMSTVPATPLAAPNLVLGLNKPHPMIVGDDSILYIANDKNVCSYNGTSGANGTFNPSALDLPDGYVITSFAKTRNFLVIYAYRPVAGGSVYRTDTAAFFWDYVSDSFTYSYPLPGFYVNGGFSYKGTVGCFVKGASIGFNFNIGKDCKMLMFNGDIFEIITIFGFNENIPGHGGVQVSDNSIFWNSNGKIYQYGSSLIGMDGGLNSPFSLGNNTIEGMLRCFDTNSLVGSAGTGAGGGLQRFVSGNGYYAATFETPYVSPPFGEYSRGRIEKIKIHWGEVVSGGNTLALRMKTAKGNTTTTIFTGLGTITAETLITEYFVDSSGNPFPIFDSFQLTGTYTAVGNATPPIIESIEVFYDNVNIGIN